MTAEARYIKIAKCPHLLFLICVLVRRASLQVISPSTDLACIMHLFFYFFTAPGEWGMFSVRVTFHKFK